MTGQFLKVVDDGQVVGRLANDQVVIINFATGLYFSLSGAGTDIWPLLTRGIDLDDLSTLLSGHYGEPRDVVHADLAVLADRLLAAGLVERLDGPASPSATPAELPTAGRYVRPILTQYDDLAESFAVDPPLMVG